MILHTVAKGLLLPTLDHRVTGSNPAEGKVLSKPKLLHCTEPLFSYIHTVEQIKRAFGDNFKDNFCQFSMENKQNYPNTLLVCSTVQIPFINHRSDVICPHDIDFCVMKWGSAWTVFHGPVILPYILKSIWCVKFMLGIIIKCDRYMYMLIDLVI